MLLKVQFSSPPSQDASLQGLILSKINLFTSSAYSILKFKQKNKKFLLYEMSNKYSPSITV